MSFRKSKPKSVIAIASTMALGHPLVLDDISTADLILCPESIVSSMKKWVALNVPTAQAEILALPLGARAELLHWLKTISRRDHVVLMDRLGWPVLDIAIAIKRPSVSDRSISAIVLSPPPLSYRKLIASIGYLPGKVSRPRLLKRLLFFSLMSTVFRFQAIKGKDSLWLAPSARPFLRWGLVKSDSQDAESNRTGKTSSPRLDGGKRNIVLLLSKDYLQEESEVDFLKKLISDISKLGFLVFIKDHVRLANRVEGSKLSSLNGESQAVVLDADMPIEALVLSLPADLVIGYNSAALGLVRCQSLSLLSLREPNVALVREAKNYFSILPNGSDIRLPSTYAELLDQLSKLH